MAGVVVVWEGGSWVLRTWTIVCGVYREKCWCYFCSLLSLGDVYICMQTLLGFSIFFSILATKLWKFKYSSKPLLTQQFNVHEKEEVCQLRVSSTLNDNCAFLKS